MKAKIKNLEKSQIEILFEMEWEEFEPYCDKAAANLSKKNPPKGFRPGKAPREVVEREIGQGKILSEAAELAVKKRYIEFVLEKDIEAIGQPQIEILKLAPSNPFSFRVRVEILPEVQLPDYKKIASSTEKKEVSVAENEVEDTLKWLQMSRAKFKDLETSAKKGNFVQIEYQSPQIENNKVYQDGFILGKGSLVPGFEENLEGMKEGEEKEFNVIFPKTAGTETAEAGENVNHPGVGPRTSEGREQLAGRKVNFQVKVKKVQEVELSALDDEFAKKLGKFEKLEDLKKNIKEGVKNEKTTTEIQRWRAEVLDKIGEKIELNVPQTLITLEKERIFQELKSKVKTSLKMSFEDYLKQTKKTEEELKKTFLVEAQKRVKNFLVLRGIGRLENIEVSDQEIEGALNEFLTDYSSVETAKKEVDLERLRDYYKGVIYNEKVFEKLENFSN